MKGYFDRKKKFIYRAMQIARLEMDQINHLHEIEKKRGYLLPNWNIQDLFHIPTLKESCGLPDEHETLSKHNRRIESDIKRSGIIAENIKGETELHAWHLYDLAVYNSKDNILWEYSGKSRRLADSLAIILALMAGLLS